MIKAILFDFDGTLADTAPDLGYALNQLRIAHGLPILSMADIRPEASAGSRGLLKLGFNINPGDDGYELMRDEFLDIYMQNLCRKTVLFPGIQDLLHNLEIRNFPWGIVTNKPARFTHPLIKKFGLQQRVVCVVCGDETDNQKPHPEPLLVASKKMAVLPAECIYLGDDLRDVEASLAAGMQPVIAGYGYLGGGQPPETWGASQMIDHPQDLLSYI